MGLLPLEGKLAAGKSPEDTSELAGTGGTQKLWTEFTTNQECDLFSFLNPIKGTVTLQVPKGQTEATEQELTAEGKLSKGLTWYSTSVYLTGKVKLKLASGKAWSFH